MTSETSQRTRKIWSWITWGTLSLLVLALAAAGIAARGPDFEVRFEREVPSSLSISQVEQSIESVLAWHQWHYITVEARMIDLRDVAYPEAEQKLMEGARIRFIVEPKQMRHKRFQLMARVEKFVPEKELTLQLVKDSTGRISELFRDLHWTLRLSPGTPQGAPGLNRGDTHSGTLIQGELRGTTSHWRSRLFGRLAPRILMHQLFYPNLVALGELTQPTLLPGQSSSSQR